MLPLPARGVNAAKCRSESVRGRSVIEPEAYRDLDPAADLFVTAKGGAETPLAYRLHGGPVQERIATRLHEFELIAPAVTENPGAYQDLALHAHAARAWRIAGGWVVQVFNIP